MAGFMDKMNSLTETTKLNGELKNLQQQRQSLMAQLGQTLYDYKKSEGGEEPDYSQMIEAIDAVTANSKAIEERIAILKGGTVCPNCSQIVPQGNRFCPHCGHEMPVPEPPQMMQAAPQARVGGGFCGCCGEPMQPGMKFCAKCGTPAG
ncbi:MAG: zinc ribbon domain-containing protein [Lachnospiraceae bacterium]|nr:zinc ribbon domain-containing protein [Lachnospiraceae bacterium]